jgi:hypothetical protein
MTAAAAIERHQSAKTSPIEIFRERCEARAVLVANGMMTLQDAVDGLWAAAERDGLVKAFGADEVQSVLAESFGRWRLCDDG